MRSYSVTLPGPARLWLNGVPQSTSYPTSRIESLQRADIVHGQKDIHDGFRKPNPYWMTYIHDERPYGRWLVRSFGRDYDYRDNLGGLTNIGVWPARYLPEVPSSFENEALIKALTKLKDQKVNLAVAAKEAQQVADMVYENANRIINGLRHLKKGRFKKAYRAIRHTPRSGYDKELASRVLEFQYGVRPLVADIHGAMEALAESQYATGRYGKPFKVVGKMRDGDKGVRKTYKVGHDTHGGYLPCLAETANYVEVTVTLWFNLKNDAIRAPASLGFTNPLAVAWEILPFSCVIDWAYPVGDWLNALDAHLGTIFRGGCTSVYRWTDTKYSGRSTPGNGESKCKGRYQHRSLNRTAYDILPIPMPPALKSPVSTEHALNALSLLTAIFRE